ncbi:MAG: HAMP domain-containing histidine kinase [Chitinophagales bacterium]|nr:HAMP domain-containing histidine kinase [Chitinophagales bacterium]
MQIKHRITLVYSIIVTVILLLFSGAIYFFRYQSTVERFNDRLQIDAKSMVNILKSKDYSPGLLKDINEAYSEAFDRKSVSIHDYKNNKRFVYYSKGADPITISDQIVQKLSANKTYFFKVGDREAVAIEYADESSNYIIAVAAFDSDRAYYLDKLKIVLGVSLLLGIIAVIVSGYIFSLSLVQTITDFTHKIKHISSERFSLRLETGKGKDELQKLAITINDLLDRLQESFNLQRRFIDNASHELSTPLASIASQMDVALQKERSSNEYKKAMLSINDDIKKLSLLVRSLLEIAKLSGSMGGTELTSVRMDELMMLMPSELKKVNDKYDVSLEFEDLPEDESSLIIYGNEHLLLSAIKNIVHNACKFSEDHRASLKLSFTRKSIRIIVSDSGPGIDEHDMKNIFQPFYRSNRHESYISGAGLGLALAHRIVRLHRGDIEVYSKLGQGTTFIIALPLEGLQEEDVVDSESAQKSASV